MQLPNSDTLFQNAACGLLVTQPDGTIQRVNNTFCHWLGYTADELVGQRRIQQLFTMGGRVFHHTHWAPLLQLQGSVAEVQMEFICRDGRVIPMLINVVRRFHGEEQYDEIATFIATDRKKYEKELLSARQTAETSLVTLRAVQQQLQESRDVLSLAMLGAKMGVWSCQLNQNREWWWSRELEALLGLPEGGFTGSDKAFWGLLHKADRASVLRAIDEALQKHSDYIIEFQLQHADGRWLPMEGRGRATYNAQGEPETLFGVVMDISERVEAQAQLRQLNDQLSLADRRKDEFLATLAHELRNPMAPMRNVLEMLKLKDFEDPQVHWAREILERQVKQMTHLVDDLMEVSRITQGRVELRKKPTDLIDVVQHAIETSRSAIEEWGHNLTVELPSAPVIIDADTTRLLQVISNLLTNAIKYTPRGGEIGVQVTSKPDKVTLTVTDSGIGIAQDELGNVFEMFSQLTPALNSSQGGLGIGLSLVRGLVELHGGTIKAYSEGAGLGSRFVLHLPLPAGAMKLEPEAPASLQAASQAQRILIIDDNTDAAETLALTLDLLGFRTMTANDGLTGLKLAQDFCPEVILLDIGLPDITGYEVARRIRTTPWGKPIKLIAVTGWGQEKDKELARDAGFNHHLTKPIDFSSLGPILKT